MRVEIDAHGHLWINSDGASEAWALREWVRQHREGLEVFTTLSNTRTTLCVHDPEVTDPSDD